MDLTCNNLSDDGHRHLEQFELRINQFDKWV